MGKLGQTNFTRNYLEAGQKIIPQDCFTEHVWKTFFLNVLTCEPPFRKIEKKKLEEFKTTNELLSLIFPPQHWCAYIQKLFKKVEQTNNLYFI